MPSLRVHCAISRERTGFNFRGLHEWIDDPFKELGINHRTERHSYNKKEENIICNHWNKEKGDGWGKKAVVEWLFHIAIDNLETAFKTARKAYRKNHVYNFFKFGMIPESKFIFVDFESLDEKELQAKFKDKYDVED